MKKSREIPTSTGRRRVRLNSQEFPSTRGNPDMPAMRAAIGKKGKHKRNGDPEEAYAATMAAYEAFEGHIEPRNYPKPIKVPLFIREPVIANQLVRYIRNGLHYGTCCKYVGITKAAFLRWMDLGRDGHEPYLTFYKRISKAEAQREEEILEKLRSHEDDDWRVSAWQLERRWPENWAKRDAVRHELKVEGQTNSTHRDNLGQKVLSDQSSKDMARKLLDGNEYGFRDITNEDSNDSEA